MDLIRRVTNGLKYDEGFRQFPYKCTANKLTIGYGRNIEEVGITEEEAKFLLFNDVNAVLEDLRTIFDCFDSYPENIQYVLMNMRFQLGSGTFRRFRNMIAAVKEQNWQRMIDEMMDSRWYRQTTKRAARLIAIIRKEIH